MSHEVSVLMPGVITIKNILTQDECKQFIESTEKEGFQPATLNLGKK